MQNKTILFLITFVCYKNYSYYLLPIIYISIVLAQSLRLQLENFFLPLTVTMVCVNFFWNNDFYVCGLRQKSLDNVLFSISTWTTMFNNLATLQNNILLVPQILGGKKESIDDINAGVKSFKTNKIFQIVGDSFISFLFNFSTRFKL